jgi:hypothetical protein
MADRDVPNHVEIKYDADKECFDIAIVLEYERGSRGENTEGPGADENANDKTLPITSDRSYRTYKAANAFGAVRSVSEQTGTNYQLILFNASRSFPVTSGPWKSTIPFHISMRRDQAAQIKDQLRILAVCSLDEPYREDGSQVIKPTIDDPVEVFIRYKYLTVQLNALWIYNYETGVVYDTMIRDTSLPASRKAQ